MHTTPPYRYALFALVLVGIFFLGYYASDQKSNKHSPKNDTGAVTTPLTPALSVPAVTPPRMIPYASPLYGFRLEYSSTYYLQAGEVDAASNPHLVGILVEDTQENRDLLDGKIVEARDGPTGMTFNVYRNPKKQNLSDWLSTDINWNIGDKSPIPASVSGVSGAAYRWSGLYEGKSVVVMHDAFIYVFSVSWMTPEDQILKDFDAMLARVEFLP